MKNEITLPNGKTYKIGFDFSTLLEVEELTGKSFGDINVNDKRDNISLMYAAIKSFNTDVEPFKEWLHNVTSINVAQDINAALADHINAFFGIPSIAEQHVEETSGEGEKNA